MNTMLIYLVTNKSKFFHKIFFINFKFFGLLKFSMEPLFILTSKKMVLFHLKNSLRFFYNLLSYQFYNMICNLNYLIIY